MSYAGIFTRNWMVQEAGGVQRASQQRQITGFGAASSSAQAMTASRATVRPRPASSGLPAWAGSAARLADAICADMAGFINPTAGGAGTAGMFVNFLTSISVAHCDENPQPRGGSNVWEAAVLIFHRVRQHIAAGQCVVDSEVFANRWGHLYSMVIRRAQAICPNPMNQETNGFGAASSSAPRAAAAMRPAQRPPVIPANLPSKGDGSAVAHCSMMLHSDPRAWVRKWVSDFEKAMVCCQRAGWPTANELISCDGVPLGVVNCNEYSQEGLTRARLVRDMFDDWARLCIAHQHITRSQEGYVLPGMQHVVGDPGIYDCFVDLQTGKTKYPVSWNSQGEGHYWCAQNWNEEQRGHQTHWYW
jgi:hypothetical protein